MFDRWFCSPSNHRVHHAVNDKYLDKNYGGVLVVWDRIFGSYCDEDEKEKCVFGTRSPLNSWDPLWANVEVYTELFKDAWHARSWADKLRVFLKPPGWRPADVAARFPKPAFDIHALQTFAPPVSRPVLAVAVGLFVALLAAVSAFLWHAESMTLNGQITGVVALMVGLWVVGALLQGRMRLGSAALLSGAVAAATWLLIT